MAGSGARRLRARRTSALVGVLAVLLTPVVACADGGGQAGARVSASSSATTSNGGSWKEPPAHRLPRGYPRSWRHHPALDNSGHRDPALWPYPRRSIWNMPLGSRARLVPFGLSKPQVTLAVEEDILVVTPDAAPRPIYYSPVGWQPGRSRCGERTSQVLVGSAPVDPSFFTDPGFFGSTPNQAAAIVRSDGTLIETQPFHACADGSLVSYTAPPAWQGGSILKGDTARNVHPGAHGASGLTAFGGTIRLGEWVPHGVIPHALKIEVWAARYLSNRLGGFRWPARNADSYHGNAYAGSNSSARMGSLLALPPSYNLARHLHSPAAQVLATALQDYGAYVVGDTKRDTVAFATEWGPDGRVLNQFDKAWGFPFYGSVAKATGDQRLFLKDMDHIYKHLEVVDDNSPANVGGRGPRMAPFAPPMAHWKG